MLIVLYAVVLVPDFFSTQDPERTDARQAFIPVQRVHLLRRAGGSSPWVPGHRRQAQSRPRCAWSGRPIRSRKVPVRFFVARLPLPGARPVRRPTSTCSAPADPTTQRIYLLGTDRLGRDQWSRIMHGTQTSMTDRPGGRGAQRRPRRRAGRHLGLFRRHDRPGDPAPDRAAAVAADHPDLARADRRPAARLDADPGLLRDHRHPVAGRLDDARPRGARPLPGAARGGLRAGRRAGRVQRACASSCATWCRPSSATSSPPARWPSR